MIFALLLLICAISTAFITYNFCPGTVTRIIISGMFRFMRISKAGKNYQTAPGRFFNYFKKISKNYCNPKNFVVK